MAFSKESIERAIARAERAREELRTAIPPSTSNTFNRAVQVVTSTPPPVNMPNFGVEALGEAPPPPPEFDPFFGVNITEQRQPPPVFVQPDTPTLRNIGDPLKQIESAEEAADKAREEFTQKPVPSIVRAAQTGLQEEALSAFGGEDSLGEYIRVANTPPEERTEADNDFLANSLNITFDEQGDPVFPAAIESALEVFGLVGGFANQQRREINTIVSTSLANALDTVIAASRETGSILPNILGFSVAVQEATNALNALLSNKFAESLPATINGETIDLMTNEGLNTMVQAILSTLDIKQTLEINKDLAGVGALQRFNNLPGGGTLELADGAEAIVAGQWFYHNTVILPGQFYSGPQWIDILRENTLVSDNNLAALHSQFPGEGNFAFFLSDTANERMLKRFFNEAELNASQAGVSVERIIAWTQWAIDNNIDPEDLRDIEDHLNRFDLSEDGSAFVKTFIELPKITERFIIGGLAEIEDATDDLFGIGLGTAITSAVQGPLRTVVAPIIVAGKIAQGENILTAATDVANYLNPLEWAGATADYLGMYKDLSGEDKIELVNSGFGAIFGALASPDELRSVIAGIEDQGVVPYLNDPENRSLLNLFATIAGEVAFDPFNVPLFFAVGPKLVFSGARALSGTRAVRAVPGVQRAVRAGDRAVSAAFRGSSNVLRNEPVGLLAEHFIRRLAYPATREISLGLGRPAVRVAGRATGATGANRVVLSGTRWGRDVLNSGIRFRAARQAIELDILQPTVIRKDATKQVAGPLETPIRPIAEVDGNLLSVVTAPIKDVPVWHNRFLTSSSFRQASTKYTFASRIARSALETSVDIMARTSLREFTRTVTEMNSLWKTLTGSADAIPGSELANAMDANRLNARPVLKRLNGGARENLNEFTYYFAESTRAIDLTKLPAYKAIQRLIKNADGLSTDEVAKRFKQEKANFNQQVMKASEEESRKLMGVTEIPLSTRVQSTIGAGLSFLYLFSPRYIIRNTAGGHLLALAYGGFPVFGADGLLNPKNFTGRRARQFLDSRGGIDQLIDGADFLGPAQLDNSTLLRKIVNVPRVIDRKVDKAIRLKVMAHQLKQQDAAWRDVILNGDGTSANIGLEGRLNQVFTDNNPYVNNFVNELRGMDNPAEIAGRIDEFVEEMITGSRKLRVTPEALLGRPLPADLHTDTLRTLLRDVNADNPAAITAALDSHKKTLLEDIQGIVKENGYDDIENIDELVVSLADDYFKDVASYASKNMSRQDLDNWISNANINLYVKMLDWVTQAEEQAIGEMVTGAKSIFKGTPFEKAYAENWDIFQKIRKDSWVYQYGIPGTRNDTSVMMPFDRDVPLAVADEHITIVGREGVDIQVRAFDPNADETYWEWIRTSKFAQGTNIVQGGGLENISREQAFEMWKRGVNGAQEFSEDGQPLAYGWQADRITVDQRIDDVGSLDNVTGPERDARVQELQGVWRDFHNAHMENVHRRLATVNEAYDNLILGPLRMDLERAGFGKLDLPPLRTDFGPGLGQPDPVEMVSRYTGQSANRAIPARPRFTEGQTPIVEQRVVELQDRLGILGAQKKKAAGGARRLGDSGVDPRQLSKKQKAAYKKLANRIIAVAEGSQASSNDILDSQITMHMTATQGVGEMIAPDSLNEVAGAIRELAAVEEMARNADAFSTQRAGFLNQFEDANGVVNVPDTVNAEAVQALQEISSDIAKIERLEQLHIELGFLEGQPLINRVAQLRGQIAAREPSEGIGDILSGGGLGKHVENELDYLLSKPDNVPDSFTYVKRGVQPGQGAITSSDALTIATTFRQALDNVTLSARNIADERQLQAQGLPSTLSRQMSDQDATVLRDIGIDAKAEFNTANTAATASARAMTDWVTHNAFAAQDADFWARWAMPWEWWMTRTLGKGGLRLAENPELIAGWARMKADLDAAQQDLPQHMRDRVRIPIPGFPEELGGGLIVDPLSPIFQFDVNPYIPFDAEGPGKVLSTGSGLGLAQSPVLTTLLNSAGVFGQFASDTPFSATPVEQWWSVVRNAMKLTGLDDNNIIPPRIRWTERDAFNVKKQIRRLVEQDPTRFTQEQIQEAQIMLDRSATPGLAGSLTNVFGGSELFRSDNPVLQAAVQMYTKQEFFSRDLGFLSGVLASITSPLDTAFFESRTELFEQFDLAVQASQGITGLDGDGGQSIRLFFEAHPEASLYFGEGDTAAEIEQSQKINQYFTKQEVFFNAEFKKIDGLPLQGRDEEGINIDVRISQQVGLIFDNFETLQLGWLNELGLQDSDVRRDTSFVSTRGSRDLFIQWKVLQIADDFRGQQAFVNSLSESDAALLEKELGNKTTNLAEHIVVMLKSLDGEDFSEFRDQNGVIDWSQRFGIRNGILDSLPGEIRTQILRLEAQFKSPRGLVRETVKDYYGENLDIFFSLGEGTDRERKVALQQEFQEAFTPPTEADIVKAIRFLRPDLTREEIISEFDLDDMLDFGAFLALQNEKKIQTLEIIDTAFYSSSGELVTNGNLPRYKLAFTELTQFNAARETAARKDWTPELEFWFGTGVEGSALMRSALVGTIDTLFDVRGQLFDLATDRGADRRVGTITNDIPGLRDRLFELMDTNQARGNTNIGSISDLLGISLETLGGLQFATVSELIDVLTAARVGGIVNTFGIPELRGLEDLSISEVIDVLSSIIEQERDTLALLKDPLSVSGDTSGPSFSVTNITEGEASTSSQRVQQLSGQEGNRSFVPGNDEVGLNKSDILRLVRNGNLEGEEAFERLIRLGFSSGDANLLVNDALEEVEKPEVKARPLFSPEAFNESSLRAKAREMLGSDRIVDELIDIFRFGRTLSRIGQKDLNILRRFFPIPGARSMEDWMDGARVMLASAATPRPQGDGFRRNEIRKVTRFTN